MEDNKWQRGMKNVNPSIPILHPWFQNKDSGTVNSHPSHAIILTYPLLSLQLWPAETFDSGTDPWLCNEPFLRGSARVICDRGIRFFFRAMRSALSFDLERETRRVQGSLCVSFDSSFIFLLGRGTIIFGRIFGHTFSNDHRRDKIIGFYKFILYNSCNCFLRATWKSNHFNSRERIVILLIRLLCDLIELNYR